MWTPAVWRACRMALSAHSAPRLVRMTHGCLDPVRLGYHHWRKLLVSPVERRLFARCARVVATCDAERDWCLAWGIRAQVEVLDLKSCFSLSSAPSNAVHSPLRLLYLGRRHPLKGLDSLVDACRGLNVELRVESRLIGAAKKAAFDWCDFLVLPTLTENFGLVVAEALEHGRRAIVTDGAPAWEEQPGVIYVKGYRSGTTSLRVNLLREAIASAASNMVECPRT